jgi:hypothetical protein
MIEGACRIASARNRTGVWNLLILFWLWLGFSGYRSGFVRCGERFPDESGVGLEKMAGRGHETTSYPLPETKSDAYSIIYIFKYQDDLRSGNCVRNIARMGYGSADFELPLIYRT